MLERMNTDKILEAAHATLAGTLPLPEIVARLIAAGVEYYHVDCVGHCKQFYDGAGGRVDVLTHGTGSAPSPSTGRAGEG